MATKSAERIYSVYYDELENVVVRKVAFANGVSPNAVGRWALRALVGLPHPEVRIPDEVRELIEAKR